MMMPAEIAFVFPGQGSQSVGMLTELAQNYPIIQAYYEQASAILNYDLWHLVQEGPAAELDKTIHTQPALLVGSYAIYQILTEHYAIKPALLAGHSLGEYTALLCANAFSFADAVKLVAARAQYMQAACAADAGAMAAIIGLTETTVQTICAQVKAQTQQVIAPANYNGPNQIVIAGQKSAVTSAMQMAKEAGAKLVTILPVSVPSHCELMLPAAKQLTPLLATLSINMPTLTVINNVTATAYESVAMIRELLTKQLYSPVRWVETIRYFQAHHITKIIECGPGKILTGLNKRIVTNLTLQTTQEVMQASKAI